MSLLRLKNIFSKTELLLDFFCLKIWQKGGGIFMRINTKKCMAVLFAIVTGLFLLSATNALAEEGHEFNKEEHRKEWQAKKAKMYEQLGLTEEQKQALKTHREGHRKGAKALIDQLKEKRKAFRQTLEDPNADAGAITAANNEMKALSNRLADDRLNGILEVRKILTPEQYKQFNELHKKHRKKKKDGRKGSHDH